MANSSEIVDWLVEQFEAAFTLERVALLAETIKADRDAGAVELSGEAEVARLLEAYKRARERLTQ